MQQGKLVLDVESRGVADQGLFIGVDGFVELLLVFRVSPPEKVEIGAGEVVSLGWRLRLCDSGFFRGGTPGK